MKYNSFLSLIPLLFVACNPAQDASYEDNALFEELECQRCSSLSQLFGGAFVADKGLTDYVYRVALRLSKVEELSLKIQNAVVLAESRPLCLATLGGEVLLSKGLLLSLENEAELAALIALNLSHDTHITRDCPSHVLALREWEKAAEWLKLAGYDQQALITLGRKLEPLALFSFNRDDLVQLKSKVRQEGYLGAHAFENALAFLKNHENAYGTLSEAEQAFQQGAWDQTLTLTEKGIESLPDEPAFFSLKAKALTALSDRAGALEALNRCVKLAPHYYAYYLQRGDLFAQMREVDQARADYEHSLALFPTQEAKEALAALPQD